MSELRQVNWLAHFYVSSLNYNMLLAKVTRYIYKMRKVFPVTLSNTPAPDIYSKSCCSVFAVGDGSTCNLVSLQLLCVRCCAVNGCFSTFRFLNSFGGVTGENSFSCSVKYVFCEEGSLAG